jgi:hypothetical protein
MIAEKSDGLSSSVRPKKPRVAEVQRGKPPSLGIRMGEE